VIRRTRLDSRTDARAGSAARNAARQKSAARQGTWLPFSRVINCGAYHDVPFQMTPLPEDLDETTAAQKLAEAHETLA